jgi:enoyl-CoA hydratase/carnithine racemase
MDLPPSLAYHDRGEIGILELNRPHKRNALDDDTVVALGAFFTEPPAGVRAIVLAAVGDHFSAGLDLSRVGGWDAVEGLASSQRWHRAFEALEFGRVPVVAVLTGAVIGGGLELAAAAHVRVAEPSAFFALPEGQRGIFVGGGGSVRIPRLIGTSRVMDMLLTGRVYDAAAGVELGLAHYLVEAGGGRTRALELAGAIAANSALSNFAAMHGLPRIADAPRASGFFAEAAIAAVTQGSSEAKGRIADFLGKRAKKVRP